MERNCIAADNEVFNVVGVEGRQPEVVPRPMHPRTLKFPYVRHRTFS